LLEFAMRVDGYIDLGLKQIDEAEEAQAQGADEPKGQDEDEVEKEDLRKSFAESVIDSVVLSVSALKPPEQADAATQQRRQQQDDAAPMRTRISSAAAGKASSGGGGGDDGSLGLDGNMLRDADLEVASERMLAATSDVTTDAEHLHVKGEGESLAVMMTDVEQVLTELELSHHPAQMREDALHAYAEHEHAREHEDKHEESDVQSGIEQRQREQGATQHGNQGLVSMDSGSLSHSPPALTGLDIARRFCSEDDPCNNTGDTGGRARVESMQQFDEASAA
jgi:hypothetical protein